MVPTPWVIPSWAGFGPRRVSVGAMRVACGMGGPGARNRAATADGVTAAASSSSTSGNRLIQPARAANSSSTASAATSGAVTVNSI
jgi:hypothetical protein